MKGFTGLVEKIRLMDVEIENLKADIFQIKRELEYKNGVNTIPTPKLETLKNLKNETKK